jgi:hypothetical protein
LTTLTHNSVADSQASLCATYVALLTRQA